MVTRFMGLIVAAMGMQFVLTGLKAFFNILDSFAQSEWPRRSAGRFGVVEDRWLIYGKLGAGWVRSSAILNFPGVSWTGWSPKDGWLVGGGIDTD